MTTSRSTYHGIPPRRAVRRDVIPHVSRLLLYGALLLGLFRAAAPVVAQEPRGLDPSLALTQYVHRTWQVEDGLPQNTVRAIAQTPDGYIWLGTQEGLVRFDGVRFTVFDRSNTSALRSNNILALLVDRNGRLWVGTHGGGIVWYSENTFVPLLHTSPLSETIVSCITEDEGGNVWAGTYDGTLIRFYDEGGHFSYTHSRITKDAILSLKPDPAGNRLWIGTASGLLLHKEDGGLVRVVPPHFDGTIIRALAFRNDSTLLIGSNTGLMLLDSRSMHFTETPASLLNVPISALHVADSECIWVGTLDRGLARSCQNRQLSWFDAGAGLPHDVVRSIFTDSEGNLWIGTDGGGLHRIAQGDFTTTGITEGLSSEMTTAVLEDHSGNLWIATEGGGVNILGESGHRTITSRDGLPSDLVYSLSLDARGTVWIGTMDGGICHLRNSEVECLDTGTVLGTRMVTSLYFREAGETLIGTNRGLFQYHTDTGVIHVPLDGLRSSHVTSIIEDGRGTLWVGTISEGLFTRPKKTDEQWRLSSLPAKSIISLFEDHEGRVWAGTQGSGLCVANTDSPTCYTTDAGLFDNTILQISGDNGGSLWLGSQRGIQQIHPDLLRASPREHSSGVAGRTFGIHDGLRSREVNGGVQPSTWKTASGSIWFTTVRGVAVVKPYAILNGPTTSHPVIEHIQANGKKSSPLDEIQLSSGTRNLEIHYTAFHYRNAERIRFKYRLEQYDDAWIEAGSRRAAYYSSLPPGTYTFRVSASVEGGDWRDVQVPLRIRVLPRFYETLWFKLLSVLFALGIGAGLYRMRVSRLKHKERLLQLRIREQTKELRSREHELRVLNSNLEAEVRRQFNLLVAERQRYEDELIVARDRAEESAKLKSHILMNMSHEVRTPITAILGYAQILLEEINDERHEFVQYILKNGNRLLDTLNSILDLARLESESSTVATEPVNLNRSLADVAELFYPMLSGRPVTIAIDLPNPEITLSLDANAINRVLQNLVSNAVKFTDEGTITLFLKSNNSYTEIGVRDTGIGISEDFLPHVFDEFTQESAGLSRTYEGSGLGLAITKRLVEEMGGTIHVNSTKGAGSVFSIRLPNNSDSNTPDLQDHNSNHILVCD